MKVEQISVFLENKSGRLAEVTRVLGEAGINIRALSLADTTDFGILRLICDNYDKAREVLKAKGFTVGKTEVLAVEVPDHPGGLGLVDENGMDWMYQNCSATAQRGALDWKPRFKKAVLPVFKELYSRVKTGKECARVLKACGAKNYQVQLAKELGQIHNSEMWTAGAACRALRTKEPARAITNGTKGVSGRMAN